MGWCQHKRAAGPHSKCLLQPNCLHNIRPAVHWMVPGDLFPQQQMGVDGMEEMKPCKWPSSRPSAPTPQATRALLTALLSTGHPKSPTETAVHFVPCLWMTKEALGGQCFPPLANHMRKRALRLCSCSTPGRRALLKSATQQKPPWATSANNLLQAKATPYVQCPSHSLPAFKARLYWKEHICLTYAFTRQWGWWWGMFLIANKSTIVSLEVGAQ